MAQSRLWRMVCVAGLLASVLVSVLSTIRSVLGVQRQKTKSVRHEVYHRSLAGLPLPAKHNTPLPPKAVGRHEYDAFDTPAVQCRLGIEKFQNDNIDYWMVNSPYPMIEWIWKMEDEKTGQPYYQGFFNVLRQKGESLERSKLIESWTWKWADDLGNEYEIPPGSFWHTSDFWTRPMFRLDPKPGSSGVPKYMWPVLVSGTDKSPPVYDLEPYVNCNRIEQENPPPMLKKKQGKTAACVTRFWGQYDLFPEWYAYHKMIGVDHFFMYVGEPFENLYTSMKQFRHEIDITYIPYNYNWKDHKHIIDEGELRWGDEDYFQETWFQVAENNACLYNAKQWGFDFIFTPDLDEYVVLKDPKISHFGKVPPLHQFLYDNHHPKTLGANTGEVCMFGPGMGRHPVKEPVETTNFELTIDFIWRTNHTWGNYRTVADGKGWGGRRKCWYNVNVADGVVIHFKDLEGAGETAWGMEDQVELYHYRAPLLGPEDTQPEWLCPYPQFRDQYRDAIVKELKKHNWPYPNLNAHVDSGYGSLEEKKE